MRFKTIAIVLIGLLLPGLAAAEFYKYRDASGALRFTDNLNEVPPAQRPEVVTYEESRPPAPAGLGPAADVPAVPDRTTELKAREAALMTEKEALDQEYQSLMEANRVFEEQKKDLIEKDPAGYQQRARELNARIEAYDAKRKMFQEKASAFGEDLKKQ